MKNDVAISVNNVKKDFYLPRHSSDSLKDTILHSFKKKDKGADVHHALKGVSFDIKKGEFFGILGRNGSGKSTLLKIISEIYQPTSGTVKHEGSLVSFIELGVGFKQNLTGRENVYLNAALLGFSKSETDAMYDNIVAFAELEDFMGQKLKNYSSGMKVRLAFAVAIQAKSDILILDEVLAVGDTAFKKKCYDYFKSLKRDKSKTVVFVSHSMNAVRDYCDKAILVEEGLIAETGSPEKVVKAYNQLFLENETKDTVKRVYSKEVKISNVNVEQSKDRIRVKIELHSSEDLKTAKLGISIRGKSGKLLTGVNNLNAKNGQKLVLKKDETKNIVFSFENVLGNDQYRLVTVVNDEEIKKVYDKKIDKLSSSFDKEYVYYPLVIPAEMEGASV